MKRELILKIVHLWLLTAFAALISCAAYAAPSKVGVISGGVYCDGKPVSGAVVSDGYRVVATDAKGQYSLKSSNKNGYVFLSIPWGYEVESDGLIPRHFIVVDQTNSANADFQLKKVDNQKCKVLIVADIHLTNSPDTKDIQQFNQTFAPDFKQMVESLRGEPFYVFTLGDMTTDSRWYRQKFALPEYKDQMKQFNTPIFHTMGNHDNDMRGGGGDWNSAGRYRKEIGPNYYSFNLGGVHVVMLDNIVYDNPLNDQGVVDKATGYHVYVENDQLLWLERDLAFVDKSTPIILCAHSPFYRIKGFDKSGRLIIDESFSKDKSVDPLRDLLKGYNVYAFTGHTHQNYNMEVDSKFYEHNNVSVAGSSWRTDRVMSKDGTPAGYLVCQVDGKEFSWKHKTIGLDPDKSQFRSHDLNQMPSFGETTPNAVYINVFNWDPKWKITVKEGGVEIPVAQIWAKDPYYTFLLEGNKYIKEGSIWHPVNNAHMFKAVASAPDTALEIEVIDRFGNIYKETMQRPKAMSIDMNFGSN